MKKQRRIFRTLISYLSFFSMIALTVTATVLIFSEVNEIYSSDKGTVSIIMLVVCLVLSLLITTVDLLRRKLTVGRSVEDILDATQSISEGNFRVRLTPRHSYNKFDDYDKIMYNLNTMASELSKSEMLKNDFISNVSHEMKTPLSIIRNYASALADEKLDTETREKYTAILIQTTDRLTTLVANILKLNKLENQQIMSEMTEVRLDESLIQSILEFEEMIESKGIELDCDIDEMTIVTSPSHLEIVWNNLLSNAIKFTPSGGKISVSLKNADGRAIVKIADNGMGMTKETGAHIFDKFYQGDTSHAKEGNGLGLALVKKVIDILGGSISVESELGKGATFIVIINGATDEK